MSLPPSLLPNPKIPVSAGAPTKKVEMFTCGRCTSSFVHVYPYVCHVLFKCSLQSTITTAFSNPQSSLTVPNLYGSTYQMAQSSKTDRYIRPNVDQILPEEPRAPLTDRRMNYLGSAHAGGKPLDNLPAGLEHPPLKSSFQLPLELRVSPHDFDLAVPAKELDPFTVSLTPQPRKNMSQTTTRTVSALPRPGLNRMCRTGSGQKSTGYHHHHQHPQNEQQPQKQQRQQQRSHMDLHTPKSGTYSNLRTANPLVEQLLQTLGKDASTTVLTNSNLLPLSQNWCARCSVSFRLTSDLVQHMRTHHNKAGHISTIPESSKKRRSIGCNPVSVPLLAEDDMIATNGPSSNTSSSVDHSSRDSSVASSNREPSYHGLNYADRKSEDELAKQIVNSITDPSTGPMDDGHLSCNLCGEIFRERHHLTRHMISHS